MQNRSKFRNSDISLQDLEAVLKHSSKPLLRSSFSTNATIPLDLSNYRVTISNQAPSNKIAYRPQHVKSSNNLRDQLSSLQQKLNNAKRQMNKTHHPIQKNAEKNQQPYRLKIKPSLPRQQQHKAEHQREKEGPLPQMKKSQIQQFISSQPKPNNITTATVNPYSSLKNNYYLAQLIRARHQKNSLAVEHINTSILILNKCNRLINSIPHQQPIVLPRIFPTTTKTLYLDLDETLIHCFENSQCEPDFRLNITIEGTPVCVEIAIRPYVLTFLKRISKKWEVVVFTASHQEYADAILDQLDPEGVLFHHRLYRQHCTLIDDIYMKDLSRINRDLSGAVLVDNAAYSYCLQLSNGIPILPYYDGKDFELSALEGYLSRLQKSEDVRVVNEGYFKLGQYGKYEDSTALIEGLYLKGHSNNFP